jgi:hypothetical protein
LLFFARVGVAAAYNDELLDSQPEAVIGGQHQWRYSALVRRSCVRPQVNKQCLYHGNLVGVGCKMQRRPAPIVRTVDVRAVCNSALDNAHIANLAR